MNFKDRWETDANGKRFIFTVEMQRALQDAGLPIEPDQIGQIKQSYSAEKPRQERERQEPRQSRESKPKPPPKPAEPDEPAIVQIDPATGKYLGRLKFYLGAKGYGFIARGGGESIFFHKSKCATEPESFDKGQWLLYDVGKTARGEEATGVEVYTGVPPE
jgi:cold shock CspA family protein